MRTVTMPETPFVIGLLAVMVALLLFTQLSLRPRLWLYPIVRQATVAKLDYETRGMQNYETDHFIIKYNETDADQVEMVAKAAEAAYQPVAELLGYERQAKSMIYIQSDRSELRKAIGWSGDESAMGVYYGGVIQVLSPKAWLQTSDQPDTFQKQGPVAHEFTHLLLDYQTSGNYTRWFTEGVAQYTEYKVNHYEWITPTNHLTGPLYSLAELEDHFDDLTNQALAYREALAAVRYLVDTKGETALRQIDKLLAQGKPLKQSIETVTGLSYDAYETAWKEWALKHMED